MNNVRFEELMERKLGDGLTAAESRELDALIARDPAFREEHDLLMRTHRLLADLTPIEPPSDLTESIMRQVAAVPVREVRKQGAGVAGLLTALQSVVDLHRRPVLKIGFAVGCVAAAALVLSVVNRPVDPVMISGSMVPDRSHFAVVDQVDISESGVSGVARTEVDSGVVVLVLDLLSPDDVAVNVSYVPGDLRLEHVDAADGSAVTVVTGPGQVRLTHQGSRQVSLIFTDLTSDGSTLHLQVASGSPYYLATERAAR